ncbi:MAG: Tyrosine-protein kinase ptk [Pseudomonadota bacterium]
MSTQPEAADRDDDEISLLDLALVVAENLRLLILGPLAVGLAALGISFLITPTFTATTLILPPQQQQSAAAAMLQQLGALGGLAGAAAGIKNPNDQFVAMLKSQTIADNLIERFKLVERYDEEFKQDARKTLEDNSKISAGKDGLIKIEVDDHDPATAAAMANAYVDELGRLMGRLALTEAQQRRAFFEKKLQATQADLTRAQQALQATGVNPNALKTSPEATVTALAELQARISAQEVKIGVLRGTLTDTAPEMRTALAELAGMRSQLARVAKSGSGNGQSESDYVARFRDFKYQETLFELMAKQYEIARVDEAREGAVLQVVDVASPPERKSKPKKALIAVLATLASGFVLLLFVFVRAAVRNDEQNPEVAGKTQRLGLALRRAVGQGGAR